MKHRLINATRLALPFFAAALVMQAGVIMDASQWLRLEFVNSATDIGIVIVIAGAIMYACGSRHASLLTAVLGAAVALLAQPIVRTLQSLSH